MNEMNFSRRGFIASLAVLGVAGAPRLWAETPPLKIQPIRGGGVDSVLSLTKIEISVGAEAPFSALHISDTHLNFWNVADFAGNAKSEAHFGRSAMDAPDIDGKIYFKSEARIAPGSFVKVKIREVIDYDLFGVAVTK